MQKYINLEMERKAEEPLDCWLPEYTQDEVVIVYEVNDFVLHWSTERN